MLPVIRGILPRNKEPVAMRCRTKTSSGDDTPSGRMPDSASKMLALPKQNARATFHLYNAPKP